MATLDQKLHVKNGSTVQEVTLYTTAEEATPEGGSSVEMSINGTKGYVALWNKSVQGGRQHTPVTIKKNNIEYWLDCIVSSPIQTFTLTLLATEYQVITLDYVEPETGVTHRIMSTSSIQSVTVDSGTTWTATIAAVDGYNPGTLSASSGTVTADTIISATEATIATRILNLSNSYYKMSDVYPNNYRTITQIPDELNSSNVTIMDNMFANCQQLTTVPDIDTSNVTRMNSMFSTCTALTSIPSLDTDQVTDMNSMFWLCTHLTTIPSLDTSSATNMGSMFYKCTALSTVPELDTSHATDMSGMFYNCSSLPTTFPWTIDCSGITASYYLANMFAGSSVTEVRLSNIKSSLKSQITSQLLKGDSTLNIIFDDPFNLYYYARDNITDYQNATTLPQENIEELTDIVTSNRAAYAFSNCKKLTSLNNVEATWDTSNLTDISYMFSKCEVLTSLDVSDWNTSNVLYMDRPFNKCKALTSLDVSHWDTSKVTYMTGTFISCEALTALDVSGWDTSQVRSMGFMFAYCYALASLDVSNWNTSNVTDMGGTFFLCKILTSLDLSDWNTSKVTTTKNMFFGCYALASLDVSNFDTSNVTDMSFTFYQCQALTSLDVSNWDTSKVTDMEQMFRQCQTLTSLDLSDWDTSKVTDMGAMFTGCRSLATLDVSNFNTSKITGLSNMFAYCQALTSLNLSNWNTSNVTSMSYMFDSCAALTTLDVSNFDTSNVTNMTEMFDSCTALTILDVSNWDTSNVTNMKDMFNQDNNLEYLIIDSSTFKFQLLANSKLNNTCKILVPQALISTYQAAENWSDHASQFEPIENYIITRSNGQVTVIPILQQFDLCYYARDHVANYQTNTVLPQTNIQELTDIVPSADANHAFASCTSLTSLNNVETTWDMSNVTKTYQMFWDCQALASLDVSDWDMSNVTQMDNMFYDCKALTVLDVSNWNISNAANIGDIFDGCQGLTSLGVSNWNTSNVTYMHGVFSHCQALTTLNVSNWDISKVTNISSMFSYCKALTSLDLSNWDTSNVRNMGYVFDNCQALTILDVSNWDTSNVTSMDFLFYSTNALQYLIIDSPTFKFKLLSDNYLNRTCKILVPQALISTYQAASVWSTYASQFEAIENYTITRSNGQVTVVPKSNAKMLTNSRYKMSDVYPYSYMTMEQVPDELDTSSLTTMNQMFANCRELTSVQPLNTDNVTDMGGMFAVCRALTTVPSLNTSNVTNMYNMFGTCVKLTTVPELDTSKATTMERMFYNCIALPAEFPWVIDCSSLSYTSGNGVNMKNMFYGSPVTKIMLTNFDDSNTLGYRPTSQLLKGDNTLTIVYVRPYVSVILHTSVNFTATYTDYADGNVKTTNLSQTITVPCNSHIKINAQATGLTHISVTKIIQGVTVDTGDATYNTAWDSGPITQETTLEIGY